MAARIRNNGTQKAVTLDSSIPVENPDFAGVVGFITWNNPAVLQGLRTMFACRENEEIQAVAITDEGIRVKIKLLEGRIIKTADGRRHGA